MYKYKSLYYSYKILQINYYSINFGSLILFNFNASIISDCSNNIVSFGTNPTNFNDSSVCGLLIAFSNLAGEGLPLAIITAAIRDEGTSRHYMPIEFPAIASIDTVLALQMIPRPYRPELQLNPHVFPMKAEGARP